MYQNNFKKYSIDKKYDEPLMVSGSAQVMQSIKNVIIVIQMAGAERAIIFAR